MTRHWGLFLRGAVTLGALALVARALDTQSITTVLRGLNAGWVALAALLLAWQIVLSALRWRVTAAALGVTLRPRRAVGEYWLAVLGNTLLPGGILGDVGRAMRLRGQAGLRAAAETVVIERLAGQLALALVTLLGFAAWFWPQPAGLAGAAGAGCLVAVLWATLRAGANRGEGPGHILGRLRIAWVLNGIWRRQLALGGAVVICNLMGYWAAAQAVGVTLTPGAALFLLPLTLTVMVLPLSINGWGLREGAAALLWPMAGIEPAAAVAASVVFGLSAILAALPGIAVPVLGQGRTTLAD